MATLLRDEYKSCLNISPILPITRIRRSSNIRLLNLGKNSLSQKFVRPTMFQPGDILFEHYEIVETFQVERSGGVFLVRNNDFPERPLVLKVLKLTNQNTEDYTAARFRNEILVTNEVQHPNVVRTYSYLRDETLVGFTMEHVALGNLRQVLDVSSPLALEHVIFVSKNILQGLSAIHLAGIIHRDIRPENILFGENDCVKICDFGVARSGSTISGGNEIAGSLEYLSPEYIKEGKLTQSSDLYSLGVVMYEMLTGKRPFPMEQLAIRAIAQRLTEPIQPPHEVQSDCPEEISKVVMGALANDPEERYKNTTEMLEALRKVSESLNVSPCSVPKEVFSKKGITESSGGSSTDITKKVDSSFEDNLAIDTSESNSELIARVFNERNKEMEKSTEIFLSSSLGKAVLGGSVIGALVAVGLPFYSTMQADTTRINKAPVKINIAKKALEPESLPVQEDPPTEEVQQAEIPDGWYVQYLRTGDILQAGKLAQELNAKGHNTQVLTSIEGSEIAFYVLFGPYEQEQSAIAAQSVLQESGIAEEELLVRFIGE